MPITKETMDSIQWMNGHPVQLDIVTKDCYCTQHVVGEEILPGLNDYPQKAVPGDCIVTVLGMKRKLVFSREEVMEVFSASLAVPPVVSSLNPSSAVIGIPSFDLHVIGSGFNPGSVIVFNGYDEPTTFISPTELTTGVNMSVWAAPAVLPVKVRNGNGMESAPVNFTFTEAGAGTLGAKKVEEKKAEAVKVEIKQEPLTKTELAKEAIKK